MRHFSYLAMLAAALFAVLPLEVCLGVRVLRRPLRLLATVLAAGAPFLVWDSLATSHGQWSFDPEQTLGPRLVGLPLEEWGFFVVIPTAIVCTLEAVRGIRAGRRPQ